MNVTLRTKLEPFHNNDDDYSAFYVWNADDELDLLGVITHPKGAGWTATGGSFGEHETRESAVEAIVSDVLSRRRQALAEMRLAQENSGATDSWREDDIEGW